ncbi:MAG: biosynthetic arginine decarboxylase [Parachlamydiales bacterium]|nr:biosynthetic arginine decarboxylase [Parachlamydiales bacterium]
MPNTLKKIQQSQDILFEKIIKKNKESYFLDTWSEEYFDVNKKGHIIVKPNKTGKGIDLYELTNSLVKRGIQPPILFRFDGIIRDRIKNIYEAFENAIQEYDYQNSYELAYPIKVNQQKHVVEVLKQSDGTHPLSLEVGSKPELIAVLSFYHLDSKKETLLLCNGYKDEKYIELALLSRKIGLRPIIIIEQYYELDLVLKLAEKLNVDLEIGFRIKLHSRGSGKWASSGGEHAKFGLNVHEINQAIKHLTSLEKENCVKLLHFHIGSQLTSIMPFKKALREAARTYVEIAKLCPAMSFFDVGGGLAIDYDGSKTSQDCSMNYTVDQYARDVVYSIGSLCKEENLKDPMIISESGRAIVAHHSILVTEVIDISYALDKNSILEPPDSEHENLLELYEIYNNLDEDNYMEALHDCWDLKDDIIERFTNGALSLEDRAYAEKVIRHLMEKILKLSKKLKFKSKEIEKLNDQLLDMYFCNFSIFQSLPDAWAIDQLFPVMPIHRLNTVPTRKSSIVDLTCDSDGTIKKFVNPKKISKSIFLHELDSKAYYLGIFLVGAYQETLGGLHNLFGDTNAVHVEVDEFGYWELKHQIEGDTIREVLEYMQYKKGDIIQNLLNSIEKSLKNQTITLEESLMLKKNFKEVLESYTYLVV